MNTCKIMTWNILEGMHLPLRDRASPAPVMDEARLRAIQEVVLANAPDVLVLNEALWSRPVDGHFVDYAQLLGFPHFFADTYDGPWGNIILARAPFASEHRFRIHNRGGLRVQLTGPAPLAISTYHPHPSRYPAHKSQDFHTLLKNVVGASVVCGDFNAISPEDAPDEVALTAAFARFAPYPATSLSRFTEGGREVFGQLAKLGYRDALPVARRRATMPTDMVTANKDSAMRIDHIWVNDTVEVLESEVLRGPLLEQASDHYPVLARVAWRS